MERGDDGCRPKDEYVEETYILRLCDFSTCGSMNLRRTGGVARRQPLFRERDEGALRDEVRRVTREGHRSLILRRGGLFEQIAARESGDLLNLVVLCKVAEGERVSYAVVRVQIRDEGRIILLRCSRPPGGLPREDLNGGRRGHNLLGHTAALAPLGRPRCSVAGKPVERSHFGITATRAAEDDLYVLLR